MAATAILAALVCAIILRQPFVAMGFGFGALVIFSLAVFKSRQMRLSPDTNAVSPVIGVILMVAITVVLAAIVFVLVSNMQQPIDSAPRIAFSKESDGIRIQQSPLGLPWATISITGCDTYPTEGNVTAGDFITDCNGNVLINHIPTNSVLYSTDFN